MKISTKTTAGLILTVGVVAAATSGITALNKSEAERKEAEYSVFIKDMRDDIFRSISLSGA